MEKILHPSTGNFILLVKIECIFHSGMKCCIWRIIFSVSVFQENVTNSESPGYQNIAQMGVSPFFLKAYKFLL